MEPVSAPPRCIAGRRRGGGGGAVRGRRQGRRFTERGGGGGGGGGSGRGRGAKGRVLCLGSLRRLHSPLRVPGDCRRVVRIQSAATWRCRGPCNATAHANPLHRPRRHCHPTRTLPHRSPAALGPPHPRIPAAAHRLRVANAASPTHRPLCPAAWGRGPATPAPPPRPQDRSFPLPRP